MVTGMRLKGQLTGVTTHGSRYLPLRKNPRTLVFYGVLGSRTRKMGKGPR